jgi:replicative DNA helicase
MKEKQIRAKLPVENYGLGRIPPQATDVEQAVLGAILIEKDSLNTVVGILKTESFYQEKHQKIYKSVLDLVSKSTPVDILTITQDLRSKGELEFVGGAFYVTELTSRINSAANIETHARIIAEMALKRDMIRIASLLEKTCFDDTEDALEILQKLSKEVYSIEGSFFSKEVDHIRKISRDVMEDVMKASKTEDGVIGKKTGINAIDKALRGLANQNLIIIASRPGMGKSSLVHTIARNNAVMFNGPVAIFSLEMSKKEVTKVMHAIQCDIECDKLISGDLTQDEWTRYNTLINPLLESDIYIDDSPGISVIELRAKARKLVAKNGVGIIVVDYAQLMTAMAGKNQMIREQEISFISRQLKEMAKELDVPVVALSQLSRAVETRGGDKRPVLSDLRESGSIEQDADIVIFLYRPSYYGFTEDKDGNPIRHDLTEAIIAKFRNGKTQTINISFNGKFKKFSDFDAHADSFTSGYRAPYKESWEEE